jgi:hypothetical protein
MAELNRPTVVTAEMQDALINPPQNGQKVWALSKGGVVVQVIWNSRSWEFFEAWYHFLKVPESVKKRMSGYYAPKENSNG